MLHRILNTPVRGLSLRRGSPTARGLRCLPRARQRRPTPRPSKLKLEVQHDARSAPGPDPVPERATGLDLRHLRLLTAQASLGEGGDAIIELRRRSRKHKDPFATLFEYLDRSGVPWELLSKMDSDIFIGVSVTLSPGHNIAGLQKLEVVKSVRPSETYDLIAPAPVNLPLRSSVSV